MSLEHVQNAVENTSGFWNSLPQYAALITSSVAIILFISKELLESRRKKKEKIRSINAVNKIAAVQGVDITESLLFIALVSNQLKIDSLINIKVNYSGELSSVKIDEYDLISIPKKIVKFSYDSILQVAKIEESKFKLFANMNDLGDYLNSSIGIFIGDLKNRNVEKLFNNLKDKKKIKKMIITRKSVLSSIEKELRKNKRYRKMVEDLDVEMVNLK